MALMRWDPFRDLISLQDRMNRLFEDSLTRNRAQDESFTAGIWSPVVDVYETENEMVIKAELPGLTREDISIEIDGNKLTLRGERRFQKDIREENYHRIERSYGAFSRSFTLPVTIKEDKVSASFKDGVLEIAISTGDPGKPKTVKIKQGQ